MSNTSEDDSQDILHQESLKRGPVSSKDDTINPTKLKKRRSLPGNPDPDAEVVALSPKTLLATNRYLCEVCHKGFQRDQNLQLHRRGHNLPWKLKQRTSAEIKKRVYVCPEVSCTHHDPSRALGDLTGIKKHFSRKHGEKKWKCDKCSKRYAVQSDWKAHAKICGTKEYRCDCGTIFSRKDSFVTHRAFCDALAEENYRINHGLAAMVGSMHSQTQDLLSPTMPSLNSSNTDTLMSSSNSDQNMSNPLKSLSLNSFFSSSSDILQNPSASRHSCLQLGGINLTGSRGSSNLPMSMGSSYMSATALLQKAAEMGARVSDDSISPILLRGFTGYSTSRRQSGSVQEPFNGHTNTSGEGSAVVNVGLMSATTDGSYVGSQSAFEMNSKWQNIDSRMTPFQQCGLLNPLLMGSENQNSLVLEGQMQRSIHEESAEGRHGRMTQDFLGLRPVGRASIGEPSSYDENASGLRFSDEKQQNQHGEHSYHQMSQDLTALEKPMWDF